MEINKDKPSKGAEQILLAQIKQEFTAPADAIEQYIDLVSQYIEENNVAVEDEVEQIKMGQKNFFLSMKKLLVKIQKAILRKIKLRRNIQS